MAKLLDNTMLVIIKFWVFPIKSKFLSIEANF